MKADLKALDVKGWTPENWMAMAAKEVAEKNQELAEGRRERLGKVGREGFLWEKIPGVSDGEDEEKRAVPDPLALIRPIGQPNGVSASRKGKEREGSFAAAMTHLDSPMHATSPLTPIADDVKMDEPAGQTPKSKKRRLGGPPLTAYDPHTHLPHGMSSRFGVWLCLT